MNNKKTMKIIEDIVPNRDTYSWIDVNCHYKPWAILHASYFPEYFDYFLFLSAFFQSTIIDGMMKDINFNEYNYYYRINSFHEFYAKVLENIFNIKLIVKRNIGSENDFHDYIMSEINKGNRVLVPTDQYNIWYYENYLIKHLEHFMIIKGYDYNRKIYYILDTTHIGSGINPLYTDFTIKFEMLYDVSVSCSNEFSKNNGLVEVWSLEKNDNMKKISVYELLKFFYEYLDKIEKDEVSSENVESYLISLLKNIDLKEVSIPNACVKLNFRTVFFDKLLEFLKVIDFKRSHEISDLKDILIKRSSKVVSLLTYQNMKNKYNFDSVSKEMEEVLSCEKQIRQIILNDLDIDVLQKYIDTKSGEYEFNTRNTKNANIVIDKDEIIIEHSQDVIYNTWILQDDAPQVFVRLDDNEKFSISSQISFTTDMLKEFHIGIICKLDNGNKFLFGNINGDKLTLYCPEISAKYLNEIPLEEKIIYVMLKHENDSLIFYYKQKEVEEWSIFYTYKITSKVLSFGIFSKTWVPVNHKAIFKEIVYTVNK